MLTLCYSCWWFFYCLEKFVYFWALATFFYTFQNMVASDRLSQQTVPGTVSGPQPNSTATFNVVQVMGIVDCMIL